MSLSSTSGTMLIAKDDARHYIGATSSRICSAQGETTGVVLVFSDETKHRQLQAQLLQAQKMEAIGSLAGGIAHDFNNMTGIIMGYAHLISQQLSPNQSMYRHAQAILNAADRSSSLTRQLLAFARRQVIAPVSVDLNQVLISLQKMLQRLVGEDIVTSITCGSDLWRIKIDPTQVDQILTNLAANARDAIDNTGSILIETSNVVIDDGYSVEHQDHLPGEYVLLAFTDSGKGMDRMTLSRLFEPFFTTKPIGKGTGLGLATVFGIVKQNNGMVNVYSEPGHGTIFKIHFPRFHGKKEERIDEKKEIVLRGSERLLIVEDEEELLDLCRQTLEEQGYHVLAAPNPAVALSLLEKNRIDMLITDVVLPGMNGKELKEKVELLIPGVKAIFASGYTADVVAHRGVLEDGVHFLQKPYSPPALLRKVREVFDLEKTG